MSIDSTQLSNILNSLERTIERDSLSQMQYQSLIDTVNSGIVVQTDWWMFGVTLFNALAFIVLTGCIWRTNRKQVLLQLRKDYIDIHRMFIQIEYLADTIFDGLFYGLGNKNIDHLLTDISDLLRKMQSHERDNIKALLNQKDIDDLSSLEFTVKSVWAGYVALQKAINEKNVKYELSGHLIIGSETKKRDEIYNALDYYLEGGRHVDTKLFLANLDVFVSKSKKYNLSKVTKEYCKI